MREIPSWDQYFMDIAIAVAKRSKDPSTQVGSVIVDEKKRVIGTGFNGMPMGITETPDMWEKPYKYSIVTHAETNAILNSIKDTRGSSLYCTLFPCAECAKTVAAAGIKKVLYLDGAYDNLVTRDIFSRCSIELIKLEETK